MPYKDPVKRREKVKQWKKENREKVKAQKKRWRARGKKENKEKAKERKKRWRERKNKEKSDGGLRVILTPMSGVVFEKCLRRLREKKARGRVERCRETRKKWRENNRDRVLAYDRKYRQQHPEAYREMRRRYRQEHTERRREAKKKWRANNRDKVAAYQRKYCHEHKEAVLNQQRERTKQQCKGVDKVIYRESPPKDPECNCGLCLSCGGWAAPWKPEWLQRLDTWLVSLSTPCLETDSEAETLSTTCTSEVDSEWGDRLDALLANESDSEVETVSVPSVAPSRRSARIAARPPVCYGDPMPEVLERKIEWHDP